MTRVPDPQKAYRQLCDDGFIVIKNVLTPEMVRELREVTDGMIEALDPENFRTHKYQGCRIFLEHQNPTITHLIAWPGAIEALAELGFDHPKFWSGYILSKPPKAPALYWHQDWTLWGDPVSAQEEPPQLFLMYYLLNTHPENGCLRAIPGTHHHRIDLHDELPTAHSEKTYFAEDSHPALFRHHPLEQNVGVEAGDLVVGDARVLHAAHANASDERRTCITLWFFPRWDALPESARAAFTQRGHAKLPDDMAEPERAMMQPLMPEPYAGSAAPAEWIRDPGEQLRGGREASLKG